MPSVLDSRLELIAKVLGKSPAVIGAVARVVEPPWDEASSKRRSTEVRVARFDEVGRATAYATCGLTAEGSPQKAVGGGRYELLLFLTKPESWAPGLLLRLAQLSCGYELSGAEDWGGLRKLAESMGCSTDFGRPLRDGYDGLAFVPYPRADKEAPRLRLCVGIHRNELPFSARQLTRELQRCRFWPVTPPRRDSVVDLYVPDDHRSDERVEHDARRLLDWLVERGDLVVKPSVLPTVAKRFAPRFRAISAEDDEQAAAGAVLRFLEDEAQVDEVFLDDSAQDELAAWFARYQLGS